MYTFETKIRVRYADTDQMGYVYYGNYAAYYEVGRVEAFRSLGLSYKELEASGIMMPVMELKVNYHKPARYDDLLTIKVSIPEFPKARIRYVYELYNEAGELVNTGETTLVFLDIKMNRPVRLPEVMKNKLNKFYNDGEPDAFFDFN
jgi:acyl-CoA thioester hydrolase